MSTIHRGAIAALTAACGTLLLSGPAAAARPRPAIHPAPARVSHAENHRRGSAPRRVRREGTLGRLSPRVIRTGRPPTGYEVTFRFYDPAATSVQIKGEWYFANPSDLSPFVSTQADPVVTPALMPSQWQPGDFPIQSPNTTSANWPVVDMSKDGAGVWSYTTPLPSGAYSYGFFVDCTSATQTGCTQVSDPSNPPWNDHNGASTGSVESTSQVYVPPDPKFDTVNYSWQAPNSRHGTLTDATYASPTSVSPAGQNYVAIYTPPGYNPHRATPYPTLYISHGGGGNEVDWSTQGDLGNIMDNLIDTRQIQPMVVVMPNAYTFPILTNYQSYDSNLTDTVIPYLQSHYHVSTSVSQRAFAGLSMGGAITNSLLFDDTSEFAYYGVMSPGFQGPPPYGNGHFTIPATSAVTPAQAAALKQVSIYVGGGWQDPIHWYAASEVSELAGLDAPVSPDFINGGHEWYTWRILLKDFLTRVAFVPSVDG